MGRWCEGEHAAVLETHPGKKEEQPGQTPCCAWEVEGFPCVSASLKEAGLILVLQKKVQKRSFWKMTAV